MILSASSSLSTLQLIVTLFGPSRMNASSARFGSKLSRSTFEPAKCFTSGSGSVARRMPHRASLNVSHSPSSNRAPLCSKKSSVQSSSLLSVMIFGLEDREYFVTAIPLTRRSFMCDMTALSSTIETPSSPCPLQLKHANRLAPTLLQSSAIENEGQRCAKVSTRATGFGLRWAVLQYCLVTVQSTGAKRSSTTGALRLALVIKKPASTDGRVHHQPRAILSLAAAREIKEGPWLCELVQGACDMEPVMSTSRSREEEEVS
mmetsp:Transcript_70909/g.198822  ORF Transcript_70909/g.198822 Transcript_70909/m.198822 type:complete len:261 (+) Transcript_70909:1318-2100(+)